MTLTQRTLLGIAILLSVLIGVYAFLFQLGATGDSDIQARFARIPLFAAFHVLGAGVALLLGGFQFLPGLRARRKALHRNMGRVYLLAVLIGGIGGLALATQADGGTAARIGFALLGVLWLISGWQAFAAIRRGEIPAHRMWMIRNFALTFAAVTLRAYLGIMTGALGLSFTEAFAIVAWLCWVPNLVVAEWLLIRQPVPRQALPG